MILIGFLALAGAPGAIQKVPKGSDWQPAKTTALALAQIVDAKLNSLSCTSFRGAFEYDGPIGRGFLGPEAEIQSPRVFRIIYPLVCASDVRQGVWISNGKSLLSQREQLKNESDRDPVKEPFPGNRPLPRPILGTWFENCGQAMLSAIGSQNKPFTQLVTEASKPGSGLSVACQERVQMMGRDKDGKEVMIPYDRIVITRTPAQEKKLGVKLFEIIIQPKHKLPTSLFNEYAKGKKLYRSDLSHMDWNISKKQTFPQKDFALTQFTF